MAGGVGEAGPLAAGAPAVAAHADCALEFTDRAQLDPNREITRNRWGTVGEIWGTVAAVLVLPGDGHRKLGEFLLSFEPPDQIAPMIETLYRNPEFA